MSLECDETVATQLVGADATRSKVVKKRLVAKGMLPFSVAVPSYQAVPGRSVVKWRAGKSGRAYLGVMGRGVWVLKAKGQKPRKCRGTDMKVILCSVPVKAKATYTATHRGQYMTGLLGSWVERV